MDRPRRKAIPDRIKLAVFLAQRGRCALTGRRLAGIHHCEWDHYPALALRPVAASGTDYEPPQLDPDYIRAVSPEAHRAKTSDDVGRIAKTKRILTTRQKHHEVLDRKVNGEEVPRASRWPKRPFPKRSRNKSST